MKHLGRELYKIIEDKRLVKRKIADDIGMDPGYLSQLMNKESFDPRTLEKICKVIGISPAYFFDDWNGEDYKVRDIHSSTIIGDATVNIGSVCQKLLDEKDKRIAEKDNIIAEKERMIKILMIQLGIEDKIAGI